MQKFPQFLCGNFDAHFVMENLTIDAVDLLQRCQSDTTVCPDEMCLHRSCVGIAKRDDDHARDVDESRLRVEDLRYGRQVTFNAMRWRPKRKQALRQLQNKCATLFEF